jgi:hypothetical protein
MHLCTNEWQGFSVLPLLAQMIVSISKEQYWPLSGTFNSLVPKSLLELEEFAGARRVCWGPKSLLGLEEFAGARRVCWGPKSLLGPEEFPGAQSRVWLEEFPGARKGNILIMDKEPFVKQLLFYSVHTRYNPAALYECVMQDLVKSMKARFKSEWFPV